MTVRVPATSTTPKSTDAPPNSPTHYPSPPAFPPAPRSESPETSPVPQPIPAPDPERLAASHAFCRDLAKRSAKNFYHAFRLLPDERRRSMDAVYAFFRKADDLVDADGPVPERRAALEAWRAEFARALEAPEPSLVGLHDPRAWPGFPAVVDTVRRHEIPPRHLFDVLDGVAMDLERAEYADDHQLDDYCDHVASAVGLTCVRVWGLLVDPARAEPHAVACGRALQLTNILRDVAEDARNGRVYLPAETLRRFEVPRADLRADRVSPPLRAALRSVAARADEYYRLAEPLAPMIRPEGRPVLLAIVNIYRALLDEIVRRDHEVLARRVALPRWRKVWIAWRAVRDAAKIPSASETDPRPSPASEPAPPAADHRIA